MAGCAERITQINRSDISSISISLTDPSLQRANNINIVNSDSLDRIIAELNEAELEPIDFWPTHRLELMFKSGRKLMIFCSGSAMKIDGLTYRLRLNIKGIVGF
jgi:hypothetical protein